MNERTFSFFCVYLMIYVCICTNETKDSYVYFVCVFLICVFGYANFFGFRKTGWCGEVFLVGWREQFIVFFSFLF